MPHTTSSHNDFSKSLQALAEYGQTEAEKLRRAIQPLRPGIESIRRAVQELDRQLNQSEFGAFRRWIITESNPEKTR